MNAMERRNDDRIGCGPMTLALPAIVLILACGITEVKNETNLTPVLEELDFPNRTVCCVTGFEYPSDCDWVADRNPDESKCSLVVLVDAVPRLRVPVGDGYEVSRDYADHRFLGGGLYTYFCKDGVAVVRRNGAPLFRYEADEVLVDMFLKGGDLHILAHKTSGGGFSYRKNGELVLEKLTGETFGRFWEDGDRVCFSFRQPVTTSDEISSRYYVVYDSDVLHVPYDSDVFQIWDIMSHGGHPCSLVTSENDTRPYLLKGGQRKSIGIPKDASMLSGNLFSAENKVGVECTYLYSDGMCESGIWVEGSEYMRFETDRSISSLCYRDGSTYCVVNPDEDAGLIYSAGEFYTMPENYQCMGFQPAAVNQGELYVALSSRTGERPLIWHEGQVDTLRMNGYVCSVSFVEAEDD